MEESRIPSPGSRPAVRTEKIAIPEDSLVFFVPDKGIFSYFSRMKKLYWSIAVAAASLLVAACASEQIVNDTVPDEKEDYAVPAGAIEGRLVVKLSASPKDESEVYDILGSLGKCHVSRCFPDAGRFEERHRKYGLDRWYVVYLDEEEPLTKSAQTARDIEGVEIVDFDYRIARNNLPFDDPYLSKQWHYYNTGDGINQVEGCDMNVVKAWELTTGSPDVIVAVCDMGVDYAHEDLAQNMWVNLAELNGISGVDDDGNGYVDDIYGYNFVALGNRGDMVGTIVPGDHGTHVAGTIAAVNNNGIGVSGMAGGDGSPDSGVRIMSVETIDPNEEYGGYTYPAIVYAADNGAVLMNCSWSFIDTDTTPDYVLEAIEYFNNEAGMDENGNQTGPMAGGVIFFSAGNDNTQKPDVPASEDCVLAIASIGADYQRAYYSNYGSWVDFTATGGDANKLNQIYSTLPDNDYGNMQGTSMAAPHATGAAALVVSRFKGEGFTRDHLIHILTATANKIIYDYNSGYSGKLGVGLIDAYAAVSNMEWTPSPVTEIEAEANSNTVVLKWIIPGEEGMIGPNRFTVYSSKGSLANLDPSAPGNDVTVSYMDVEEKRIGDEVSISFPGLEFSRTYHFRIAGENFNGEVSGLSREIEVTVPANNPPVIEALDPVNITLRAYEQEIIRFRITDEDGHSLTWSVDPVPAGAVCTGSGNVVVISIDASKAEGGKTYSGTLTVTDSYDTCSMDFSYTVLDNNAPEVIGAAVPIVLNAISEQKVVDLGEFFSDPDGEQLKYSCVLSSSTVLAKMATNLNALTITAAVYGACDLTVTATDACGETAVLTFPLIVRDGSRPVDLYPNPVEKELNVRLPQAGTVDVTISNKAGAILFSEKNVESGPASPYQVDMSGYGTGTYYVRISGEGIDETMSVIKK